MASDSEVHINNDPNFAVICSFLDVFGKECGLEGISITDLQKSLENTHEITDRLRDLHLKLLRRALKSVQTEKWEKGLIKFCHQQSCYQDAWELERFGYKKANISVKLKILKNLLAYQFMCHTKFKNDVNKLESERLRLQPIGKDSKGRVYWLQIDKKANLRLYREDQDEETWLLIASDKPTLVAVINALKCGGEPNGPSTSEVVNDDSNSVDDLPNDSIKEINKSLLEDKISHSDCNSDDQSSLKSKCCSEDDINTRTYTVNESVGIDSEGIKLKIKNVNNKIVSENQSPDNVISEMNTSSKSNIFPKKRLKIEDIQTSSNSSSVVGDAIEEDVMIFKSEGNGSECESYPFYVSEEIADPVMYFWGDGQGHNCFTGNPMVGTSDNNENTKSDNNISEDEEGLCHEKQNDNKNESNVESRQDNGLIAKSTNEIVDPSKITDVESDNENLKVPCAPLPVTKRILLNIPKTDSTESNSAECTVSKTKLWSVEDMCNDNSLKSESRDDNNVKTEEKASIKINTVLLDTKKCDNISKSDKLIDNSFSSSDESKEFATNNLPHDVHTNVTEKNNSDCTNSNVSLDNHVNNKTSDSINTGQECNESSGNEVILNKIEKPVVCSNIDLHEESNKTVKIEKSIEPIIVNANCEDKTSCQSAIEQNFATEDLSLKLENQSKIHGKHKKINLISKDAPSVVSSNSEILPKKPKLDSINLNKEENVESENPDIKSENRISKCEINNDNSKGNLSSKETMSTESDMKFDGNESKLISPSQNKHESLDRNNVDESNMISSENALGNVDNPDCLKGKISRTLRSNKEHITKPIKTKSKFVATALIEDCNANKKSKKCSILPHTPYISNLKNKKTLKRMEQNSGLKKSAISENTTSKECKISRKRGHEESESIENANQQKGIKRIKMKSRKSLRVKYKLNKEVNDHSSGEESAILNKMEKSTKGKSRKVKSQLKISPKTTTPKLQKKKKEIALDDKDEKGDEKPNIPEVDPLDISDQAPVRQSRRIAQIKIQEEAQRRQMEEVALREMKEQHKKKGDKQKVDNEWQESSQEGSSDSEKKKSPKKKGKIRKDDKSWKTGWHSSSVEHSDTESDGPLEELEYQDVDDDYLKEKSDHEFSPESDDEVAEILPIRTARTLRKRALLDEEEKKEEEDGDGGCGACGGRGQPEWILLCDDCDAGRHAACLKPILFVIPEGHWYCPPCDQKRLINALEGKLVEYEELVTAIENEPKEEEEPAKEEDVDSDGSHTSSKSDSETSSSSEDSEDGKIYRLRERKQLPISYHFKEYDQLISSAIKEEYHEKTSSAGNQGRGKDISTIIEADKEEKQKAKEAQKNSENGGDENEEGSEAEAEKKRRERARAAAMRRRPRKLNSLEVLSEDDDDNSDEDFKETAWTSSSSDGSHSENESDSEDHTSDSLPLRRSQRDSNHSKRRKRLIESPELKKKRNNIIDDDDTTSESSGSKAWGSSKKRRNKMFSKMSHKRKNKKKSSRKDRNKRKTKILSSSDEGPKKPKSRVRYGGLNSDSDASHDWSPAHRTRQVKMNYTEIPNTDSEAEAHKPSGKHMDSTDEYKEEDSDTTDSDSDKPFKQMKFFESSDELEKQISPAGKDSVKEKEKDGDKTNSETVEEAAVLTEKGSHENIAETSKDVSDETPQKTIDEANSVKATTAPPQLPHGSHSRGGARARRGAPSNRGHGERRFSSVNTSATDGEGNIEGSQAKSDEGNSTGEGRPVRKKQQTKRTVLPLTPHQIERERKRIEREAILAEREKKKQEKLKQKEEKAQLKEQKAKEREEKKQARLALIESRKNKKLKDMDGNEVPISSHSELNRINSLNVPTPFRSLVRGQVPAQMRLPTQRLLRPPYPQNFFPRPGMERPMRPQNFSAPMRMKSPSNVERDCKPSAPPQHNYGPNNFAPMQMAVGQRVRPPGMQGPRGEMVNPNSLKGALSPQSPRPGISGNRIRQTTPLNFARDSGSSNSASGDAEPPARSEPQVKGGIRALTPAELMAPGRSISQGPVGMMERLVQNPGQRPSPFMNAMIKSEPMNPNIPTDMSPNKRRGRGQGKKTPSRQGMPMPGNGEMSHHMPGHRPPNANSPMMNNASPSVSNMPEGTLSVAGSPQPFKPATDPPSIITRMPHMMPPPYRGHAAFGANRPIYGSPSRPPPHMNMYRPHPPHPHDPSPSGGGPLSMPPDRVNARPQYPPYSAGPYYPHQMPYHPRYPPPSEMPPTHRPNSDRSEDRGDERLIMPKQEPPRSPASSMSPTASPQMSSHSSPAASPRPSPHSSPPPTAAPPSEGSFSSAASPPPQSERSTSPQRTERQHGKSVEPKTEKLRARVTSAARYPQGPYAPQYGPYGPYAPGASQPAADVGPNKPKAFDSRSDCPVASPPVAPPAARTDGQSEGRAFVPSELQPIDRSGRQTVAQPDAQPAAQMASDAVEETGEFGGLVSYFSSQREDDIEE